MGLTALSLGGFSKVVLSCFSSLFQSQHATNCPMINLLLQIAANDSGVVKRRDQVREIGLGGFLAYLPDLVPQAIESDPER